MDIKNQSTTKIPTVRTFAKDLELGRKNKKLTPESNNGEAKKEVGNTDFTAVKAEVTKPKPEKEIITSVEKPTIATDLKKPLAKTDKKNSPAIPRRNTFIVENEDSAAATIITDTKHNRFKLAPAIKSSLSGWFNSKKDSYKASKIPKYTVPETTLRKGVIQKATSNTGRLAASDFSSIHERIRNRKEKESQQKITTTWSANTEPGFLLLENSSNNVVNVQATSRRSFRTSPQEIVVTQISRNKIAAVSPTSSEQEFESPMIPFVEPNKVETVAEISPEISATVVATTASNSAATSETLTTPEENSPSVESAIEIEKATTEATNNWNVNEPNEEQATTYELIEPTSGEIISTPEETYTRVPTFENQDYEPRWESEMPAGYSPIEVSENIATISPEYISPTTTETYTEIPMEQPPIETKIPLTEQPETAKESLIAQVKKKGLLSLNTNTLTLSVSGFALLIVIIVGSSYFWYNNQEENILINNKTEIAQIINVPLEKVSVTDNRRESFQTALTKTRDEESGTSQIIFLAGQPNYEPIPPSTILSTLDIFLEQNFVRSISTIRFGFTNDKKPFVIIKTTNENVARGGMLMWEMGMYEDLAEVFSLTKTDTLTKFTDSSLDETDLRVLKNEAGSEQLIYGIKNNTVIITTNIFNFSELSRLTSK